MKVVAAKAGMSLEEYKVRIATEKWCYHCKTFHDRSAFTRDRSRYDGLEPKCRASRNMHNDNPGQAEVMRRNWQKRKANGPIVHPMAGKHFPAGDWKGGNKKGWKNPRKGIPRSPAERLKISAATRETSNKRSGPLNHNYKDGKSAERFGLRRSANYLRWRFDVFVRDGFTCQRCGDNRGGNLVAHHIKPFADFPDLRFVVSNGMTVCRSCHKQIHKEKA